MLVGLLFGLEFLVVGEGLRHTSASHMVVFLYTAPVFAALGLHWRLRAERLQPLQWGGIALAFGGIAWAFLGRGAVPAGGDNPLLGDALGLLGGAAWGATTVAVRCSRLASAPATETLLYQLVGGCVLLLAAACVLGQTTFTLTPSLLGNLAFQALVVSFASYLVWFWLLRQYLASRLGVFSFLTPLFGVGLGVGLLGEPLEPGFVQGAALVLAGIVLVSSQGWLAQRASKRRRQGRAAAATVAAGRRAD
jgi:drug/metabolite transporter (DMT)-like permease